MRRLDNIPFSFRVAILATIFVIPLLIVLGFFVTERFAVIATTQSEMRGLRLLEPVTAVLSDLARAPGDTARLNGDLERLGTANDLIGDALGLGDRIREFLGHPVNPTPQGRLAAARTLIAIASGIDDAAGLTRDAGSGSDRLIELSVVRLPKMILRNLELRAAVAASSQALAARSTTDIALIAGRLDAHNQSFSESIARAMAALPDTGVRSKLAAIRQLLHAATQRLTDSAVGNGAMGLEPAALRAAEATAEAFTTIEAVAQDQLAQRLDGERNTLLSRIALVGTLVALGAVFARITARSITDPVRSMTQAVTNLAARSAVPMSWPVAREDEIGQMSEALSILQQRLIDADWARVERKEALDALSRNEQAFRLPFEANPLPMWVYDRKTMRFLDANRAVVETYGWSREKILTMTVLDVVVPDDRERAEAATQRRRPVGQASGPWTHVRADGSHLTVQAFSQSIQFAGHDAVLTATFDITETKRLEDQLFQASKMEAVGRLAGGIAHDFNNILGAILGFAGFLVEDLAPGSGVHRFASRIVAAGERGRDLVKQILAFSRLENVERKPTDLAAVVHEMTEMLRSATPATTQVTVTAATDRIVANVNATHIGQIVMNLCINANDALKGEPGRIDVALDRVGPAEDGERRPAPPGFLVPTNGSQEYHVASGDLDPGRAYALIAVADSGVGMLQAQLDRIFEPFYTTKSRAEGTGLGLSIVHRIVHGYDGAVQVTSRPGIGTVFRVYIPLTEDAVRPGKVIVDAIGGPERVLVIDDETMITEMLDIGLTRLGYEVTTINDPLEALRLYAASPQDWDIVISDQVMPGQRGSDLFLQMKAINPALRFILCTGYSDATTKPTALAGGIDAFFHKPVGPELLAATIRQLLDRRSERQA